MDTKRFHNPEYKRQIHANRIHRRTAAPRPEGRAVKILHRVGLKSPVRQVFACLVLLFLIYLSYFAKFLWIDNLEVKGATVDEATHINQIFDQYRSKNLYFILPQKNLLFFNAEYFSQYLADRDYQISSIVNLKKHLLNKAEIEINQRVPAYVLQSSNGTFILNSDGVVSDQIQDASTALYPKILLTGGETVSSGEEILTPQKNTFISVLNSDFKDKTGLDIDRFEMADKGSEQVNLFTKNNFAIYFNFSEDPRDYLNKFWTIYSNLNTDQQNKLFYADLRFNQNAYLCYRGDTCAQ